MFGIFDHVWGALTVRLRRFFYNVLHRPDLSKIKSNLYFGGFCNIENLSKSGIHAILDLREEREDNSLDIEKFSLFYKRLKIPDRGVPSDDETSTAVSWIDDQLKKNHNVFIHCNLGRGRAPLIACIYLISKDMEWKTAIKFIKKCRRYTYFNKKQIQFLKNF